MSKIMEDVRDVPRDVPGLDRLVDMFDQQRAFMHLLQRERTFPEFPVDLRTKSGQRECKQVVYEIMGELFEVIGELKHSKSHRATDLSGELDRKKLVEELVDSLHYFVELCILLNVAPSELFNAYIEKGETNTKRILSNY